MNDLQRRRVQALEQVFSHIATTRMRDVPVQNLTLRVQAVGFQPHSGTAGELLLGVLVTPWFMNLVRLPCEAMALGAAWLAVGQRGRHQLGAESFDFLGAYEDAVGAFEVCSLFSPMFEFTDHAEAVATANEVLKMLRQPLQIPPVATPTVPSRRGFLFGRSAAGSGV